MFAGYLLVCFLLGWLFGWLDSIQFDLIRFTHPTAAGSSQADRQAIRRMHRQSTALGTWCGVPIVQQASQQHDGYHAPSPVCDAFGASDQPTDFDFSPSFSPSNLIASSALPHACSCNCICDCVCIRIHNLSPPSDPNAPTQPKRTHHRHRRTYLQMLALQRLLQSMGPLTCGLHIDTDNNDDRNDDDAPRIQLERDDHNYDWPWCTPQSSLSPSLSPPLSPPPPSVPTKTSVMHHCVGRIYLHCYDFLHHLLTTQYLNCRPCSHAHLQRYRCSYVCSSSYSCSQRYSLFQLLQTKAGKTSDATASTSTPADEAPATSAANKDNDNNNNDETDPDDMTNQGDSTKIKEREDKIQQQSKAAKARVERNRATIRAQPLDFSADYVAPSYPKSIEGINFLDEVLGTNFIFSDLTENERTLLINAMQKQSGKKDEIIIQQGDVGDFFYIVESGTVAFIADDKHVGSCARGASFGELALLYDAPRAATCQAETDVELWKVDQLTFRHLLARQAKDHEASLQSLLAKVPLLKDLDRTQVNKFVTILTTLKFSKGERIVNKGDVGDIFYIVNEGSVKVHDIGMGDSKFVDQVLEEGDWFGERALMTGEPRAANVTAITDCECFAIDRETFEQTIGSLEVILGHGYKKRFLKGVPLFANSSLREIEYDQLVTCLREEKYSKGDTIPGRMNIVIVKEGKLTLQKDSQTKQGGDYYGEKAIKNKSKGSAAVCEEDTTVWMLSREDIKTVIGTVKRLGENIRWRPSRMKTDITLDALKRHRILGMGAFGRVWLVTDRAMKEPTPYALKTISKRQLIQANQVKGVLREKQIMNQIDHPFILGLISSMQDKNNLYLLLPLIQGGELFNVVHTDKRDGITNSASIFYAACILEALGHLHERNIVYRDMKPENALIDNRGYCIMVDLGFAKVVVDKTYTLCGTPEYLAPEIIMSKGHDKAVDYWSFGVLIYEMLVGRSPFYFYGTDQVSLFKRIVMVKYSCPPAVSEDAKSLIKQLLVRRQSSRLGNLSRGYHDVKEHQWFAPMDFDALLRYELKAPWIPNIKNPLDASHFEDFSREEREVSKEAPLTPPEQDLFASF